MPYIEDDQRDRLRRPGRRPGTPGELNYAVTKLADQFIADRGGISYTAINEVIGVLECAKLELYRRLAAPYEDGKIAENGDVYNAAPQPAEMRLARLEHLARVNRGG